MNVVIIAVLTLSTLVGIIWMTVVFTPRLYDKIKNWPPPIERANIKKEKALLKIILLDIKENTNHWVQNGFAPMSTRQKPMLVNDHKNMAITLSFKDPSVIIRFDLQDILLINDDTDAITTTISGEHTLKFIHAATRLLDYRGKELEYLTERLQEKL